ncbi:MAG: diphthine--ammonia ligase [Candidatus Aenigmarchaeota archaeon]|nr:diphthine--ammonia ligase [Candidatus Aenigmarchaeota archaeon]
MRTAVLFSGGKDSCLALHYALQSTDVKCLITVVSENPASYMFHTPNITLAEKQAEAIGLPIIIEKTKGEREIELKDLEKAIKKAKEKYEIEGIVTGAVSSVYQSSRVQKICDELNLQCINPLWQRDQFELLQEVIKLNFDVIIIGVFAYGLDDFIGRKVDRKFIDDIKILNEKYKISPCGEGGEFESFVLDADFFKKKLKIEKSHVEKDKEGGRILILDKIKIVKK